MGATGVVKLVEAEEPLSTTTSFINASTSAESELSREKYVLRASISVSVEQPREPRWVGKRLNRRKCGLIRKCVSCVEYLPC